MSTKPGGTSFKLCKKTDREDSHPSRTMTLKQSQFQTDWTKEEKKGHFAGVPSLLPHFNTIKDLLQDLNVNVNLWSSLNLKNRHLYKLEH